MEWIHLIAPVTVALLAVAGVALRLVAGRGKG
jgi:hypothetical protein